MSNPRRFLTLAAVALAALGALGLDGGRINNAVREVASTVAPAAQARFGRPLTPVSVAGVGRRTVRRCAAGVYNC